MSQKKNTKKSKKQMVINYVPGDECRVAVLEDGRLEELHAERAGSMSYVGNIYVGKVTNVEPSIQAAFIDFGLESNGFLHISDLHPRYFPGDEKTEKIGQKTPRRERPPIQACLKRGQEIIVQVLKEGINTKGPTLTSYLSIPGRYLVMLPWMDKVGVSRKVEDDDQRREMRKVLDTLELPGDFGFIMRTAGMGRTKAELKRDLAFLQRLWKDLDKRRKQGRQPRLLYAESDLLMRSLRDVWTSDIAEIVIDEERALDRASRFMKIVSPRSSTKLLNYDRGTPIFHAFGIERQIAMMHAREVPLPSGGSLIIDETEAMIAIDVNSGKMRSNKDAETTAFRTNQEAVDEICRQLRLRDLGGLVICDLIDMSRRSNRRDIENQMRDLLKADRAASKALPISQFGMVEMTRQRVRGSLRSQHFGKCPTCQGRGYLQRPDSVAADAVREVGALLDQEKVAKVEMVVSPRVATVLLSSKRQGLGAMERRTGKRVDVRVSEDVGADRVVFYAYDPSGADVALDKLPSIKPPTDLKEWSHTPEPGEDWAVDITHEAPEEPEEAPMPTGSAGDVWGEGSGGESEEEREGSGGRRRRRRRRGGSGDSDEPREPQERARESDASGPSDEEGEGGGKKRRRRRRRRRKGEEGDEGEQDQRPSEKAREKPRSGATPEEPHAPVMVAVEGEGESEGERERESRAGEGEGEGEGEGKSKRRRGKRGGRRRRKGGEGEPSREGEPAPAKDEQAPERKGRGSGRKAEDDRGDSSDAKADEGDSGEGGEGKRRRGKRGGRKRSRKAGETSGDAGEARSESTDSKDSGGEAEGEAKPRRSSGGRKKTTRKKTPAKSEGKEAKGSDAKPDPSATPVVKPARSLYNTRRRLKPAEVATRLPNREE